MGPLNYLIARMWRKNLQDGNTEIHSSDVGSRESLYTYLDDKRKGKHQGHDGEFALYVDGKFIKFYSDSQSLNEAVPQPRLFSRNYDVCVAKVQANQKRNLHSTLQN